MSCYEDILQTYFLMKYSKVWNSYIFISEADFYRSGGRTHEEPADLVSQQESGGVIHEDRRQEEGPSQARVSWNRNQDPKWVEINTNKHW